MKSSIRIFHRFINTLVRKVPGKTIEDKLNKGPFYLSEAYAAFQYQLTAYLALQNMLSQYDESLVSKILNGSSDELERWLLLISGEGSVLG